MIEIARDDLRPLARAISVEQADAAAENATETLLADLLCWAARSRTRRATTPWGPRCGSSSTVPGVEAVEPRGGGVLVDTYAARRTSHDGSHGSRPVGGGVDR